LHHWCDASAIFFFCLLDIFLAKFELFFSGGKSTQTISPTERSIAYGTFSSLGSNQKLVGKIKAFGGQEMD